MSSGRSALHEAARRYQAAGLRVFPSVPRSKRPLVEWAEFQRRAPTSVEIDTWWTPNPEANIQCVTGNGILVLDFDRTNADQARALLVSEGVNLHDDTPLVQSPGGGVHFWVGIDREVRPATNIFRVEKEELKKGAPQVDVRGDGSVVTVPPSIHANGQPYRWVKPFRTPLPAAPGELYAMLERLDRLRRQARDRMARDQGWVSQSLRGIGKGERQDTLTRLAGYYLGKGIPDDITISTLEPFGRACDPPISPREIELTVRSVARTKSREELAVQADGEVASDIAAVADDWIEERRTGFAQPIPTPIPTLSRWMNGGFRPGTLTYLAARPGLGKSALAVQCGLWAARRGKRSLIVSLEMMNTEVFLRMIAQEGQHDGSMLMSEDAVRDQNVLATVGQLKRFAGLVKMYDRPVGVPGMKRLIEVHQPDLFILDYLQITDVDKGQRDRRVQIEQISKELKVGMAKAYRIPVLALSSLSRLGDSKRPGLHNLRESGQLEHDCDTAIFMHAEEDDREMVDRPIEIIVDKNRGGRLGSFKAKFYGPYYALREEREMPDDYDPPPSHVDTGGDDIPASF